MNATELQAHVNRFLAEIERAQTIDVPQDVRDALGKAVHALEYVDELLTVD